MNLAGKYAERFLAIPLRENAARRQVLQEFLAELHTHIVVLLQGVTTVGSAFTAFEEGRREWVAFAGRTRCKPEDFDNVILPGWPGLAALYAKARTERSREQYQERLERMRRAGHRARPLR